MKAPGSWGLGLAWRGAGSLGDLRCGRFLGDVVTFFLIFFFLSCAFSISFWKVVVSVYGGCVVRSSMGQIGGGADSLCFYRSLHICCCDSRIGFFPASAVDGKRKRPVCDWVDEVVCVCVCLLCV